MKVNIFLLNIIIILLLYGCKPDPEKGIEVIYKNESSKNLQLLFYFGSSVSNAKVTMMPNSIYSDNGNTILFNAIVSADSARMIFNDTMQVVYYRTSIDPRSVLNQNAYTVSYDGQFSIYTYTIINDDYLKAVKIQ